MTVHGQIRNHDNPSVKSTPHCHSFDVHIHPIEVTVSPGGTSNTKVCVELYNRIILHHCTAYYVYSQMPIDIPVLIHLIYYARPFQVHLEYSSTY